ncbi:MAG: VOC family protein [Caulobacter sp.]|nr:VOC family protein [Caulobacter sp.]
MDGLASAKVVTFILTGDRAASKAWYMDVLGLPLIADDPFASVLTMNGAVLRIVHIDGYEAGAHPVLGWEVADIAAAIETLVSRGVTMTIYEGFGQDALGVWTSPDGKAKVAWFNDPDGNVLSLAQH